MPMVHTCANNCMLTCGYFRIRIERNKFINNNCKIYNMELQGRVIVVMEPREGTSARGPWKSQQYVIETHDQYPKKMVFDIFGADRIDQFAIKAGEEIIVSFDVDAHEYNGRWFNNIRAWNIQRLDAAAAQAAGAPAAATPAPATGAQTAASGSQAPFPPAASDSDADDLPF